MFKFFLKNVLHGLARGLAEQRVHLTTDELIRLRDAIEEALAKFNAELDARGAGKLRVIAGQEWEQMPLRQRRGIIRRVLEEAAKGEPAEGN
jgi:hypothetical protein